MKRVLKELVVYLTLVPLGLLSLYTWDHFRPPAPVVKVGEVYLSHRANRVVTPLYPRESSTAHTTGKAVAAIELNELGAVDAVQILESPDQYISAEVERAVKQWTFEPVQMTTASMQKRPNTPTRVPVRLMSRISFEFTMNDGSPRVIGPAVHNRGDDNEQ
jgi:TonB family protein